MCLVCIAFASWVLKSANPQAGDAWKADDFFIFSLPCRFIHRRSHKIKMFIGLSVTTDDFRCLCNW
uniref:Secreted protein n=1 Tax=Oncorhynchus mykiss TaxID=8022 RepID=A0A8K9XXX3_ONCMY